MTKEKTAKFEMTLDELEVLIYILMDWRTNKAQGGPVEYPNQAATSTRFVRFFHAAWTDLHEKVHKK